MKIPQTITLDGGDRYTVMLNGKYFEREADIGNFSFTDDLAKAYLYVTRQDAERDARVIAKKLRGNISVRAL